MLTIPADKILRMGDVAVNLAHVALVRFHCPPRGPRQASVTLAVSETPGGPPAILTFEGKEADELYGYFGGPFDG